MMIVRLCATFLRTQSKLEDSTAGNMKARGLTPEKSGGRVPLSLGGAGKEPELWQRLLLIC